LRAYLRNWLKITALLKRVGPFLNGPKLHEVHNLCVPQLKRELDDYTWDLILACYFHLIKE
jgi:hypothetical protein